MRTGVYRFPPMDSVIYGRPFAEALKEEVEASGANSVFLLASGTIDRETDMVEQVRDALGNRLAGVCAKIGAHTPRIDVVAAANAARAAGADLLVTLGGGSVTDAAKMVAFCLGNGVTDPAQLDNYRATVSADGTIERPQVKPPAMRTIAIPTTLVGRRVHRLGRLHRHGAAGQGELRPSADDAEERGARPARQPPHPGMAVPVDRHPRRRSRGRGHLLARVPADLGGRLIPCPETARPRAVGGQGGPARPRRAARLPARRLDVDGRLANRRAQGGEPRHRPCAGRHRPCAARLHLLRDAAACAALQRSRSMPSARRWSARRWAGPASPPPMSSPALIAGLGLPGRLRDVGVKPEQLDRIAELSMHDRWIHTNPRKIDGPPVGPRAARRGVVDVFPSMPATRDGYAAFSNSRRIVSPMTRVETRAVLGWTMSAVRTPAASARRTASSTRLASSARSNE